MRPNQLSRYGAIDKAIKALGPSGKVFFVKATTDSDFADFEAQFPVDEDGVVRTYSTIQGAVNACVGGRGDVVLITTPNMSAGATDPTSYAETVIVAAGQSGVTLAGVPSYNRTQGGLPQIKKGSGSVSLLTLRAPGVTVLNIGFNGSGSTGGGILLDDDGSTKSAFGTSITGCHFKNLKGSSATNSATGGAIQWASTGGAWQVNISGNSFYNNVGGIVLLGTSASVPQDVIIENNTFHGGAATDTYLYLSAGSGMTGLVIKGNTFGTFPTLGSATNATYMILTNCTGVMADNFFGSSGKTFGATSDVKVPITVLMAGNYQEGGLIARS